MKYKLKIINENQMYVGYVLKDSCIVHKTEPHKDSVSCSTQLRKYVENQPNYTASVSNVVPKISNSSRATSLRSHSLPAARTKRCCGR